MKAKQTETSRRARRPYKGGLDFLESGGQTDGSYDICVLNVIWCVLYLQYERSFGLDVCAFIEFFLEYMQFSLAIGFSELMFLLFVL